ncbi:MAG: glycosyltransferase family 2 protein, partial [Candidatus Omnitrophota bacterium]
MKPTIGILITYHNEKGLLTECLDSIFSQTKSPDEIIVYDDCSEFPARDYIPKEHNVKLIRSPINRGPGHGRNCLLKESRCDYVHFHDADDLFNPLWCENVISAIVATGADIIFTEVSAYKDNKMVCKSVMGFEGLIGRQQDAVLFAMSNSILTISSTSRRETVLKIGGFRTQDILSQSEDYDFHIRILVSGASYSVVMEPMLIQRLRDESHSSKNIIEAWNSAVKSIVLFSKDFPAQYHDHLPEVAAKAGSRLYSLGAYKEAKRAFSIAYSLGKPKFMYRSRLYKIVAERLGPLAAEKISLAYRMLVPEFIRRK